MQDKNDSLGNRMKEYENIPNIKLPRRIPMILRVDGKAFHTYAKNCKKPFDDELINLMDDTAKHLCENIQNAQIAYVQSDEISILVNDHRTWQSEAWFDKKVQKMCSIASATAATHFTMNSWKIFSSNNYTGTPLIESASADRLDFCKPALFDARVFVLPEFEVCNYFIWRQQDAVRNSIQMQARALYSHKECDNKNQSDLQEMIFQKGQNWNDLAIKYKRGRCVYKVIKPGTYTNARTGETTSFMRSSWEVDYNIPTFSAERMFIDKHLRMKETE